MRDRIRQKCLVLAAVPQPYRIFCTNPSDNSEKSGTSDPSDLSGLNLAEKQAGAHHYDAPPQLVVACGYGLFLDIFDSLSVAVGCDCIDDVCTGCKIIDIIFLTCGEDGCADHDTVEIIDCHFDIFGGCDYVVDNADKLSSVDNHFGDTRTGFGQNLHS